MAVSLAHPEAERAVLAAILLAAGECYESGHLAELLPSDFAEPKHRTIFSAMVELHGDETPVDLRTVQARLEQRGHLEGVGGLAYLVGLELDLPDLGRFGAYVRIVKDAAIRRTLAESLRRGAQKLQDGEATFGEVVSEANAALRKADERSATDELVPLGQCFVRVLEAAANPSPTGLVGIPTGYSELDRMTLGWQPGQIIFVAARPSQGKTALACCMARASVDAGSPGVFFSLEMGRDDLAARLVCSETGLPFNLIRSGHLTLGRRALVERAVRNLSSLRLKLNDSPYLTPSRLAALIRRAKRQDGIQIAFIDYLGLMGSDERHENQNLRLAAISRSLKVTAKELEIPIVVLHQLSRAPEKRADTRPQLSDLRDSGALEQDADVAILIYRDPNGDGTEAELIVAKQRNGMVGTVKVRPRLEAFRFEDPHPAPPQAGLVY